MIGNISIDDKTTTAANKAWSLLQWKASNNKAWSLLPWKSVNGHDKNTNATIAATNTNANDASGKKHLGLTVPHKLLDRPPMSFKLSIRACGLQGEPRRCAVDSSEFDPMFQEGDVIDIDFGPEHCYTCHANHRGSGACVSISPGKNLMGALNVITRGTDSHGGDNIFGSTSVGGEICDFSPDATGSTLIVQCKSENEYPSETELTEDDL